MSTEQNGLDEALARISFLESHLAGTNAALTAVALLLRQTPGFNPDEARRLIQLAQQRCRPPDADPAVFRLALDAFRFYILGTDAPADVVQMPRPHPASPDQSPEVVDD